MIRFRSTKTVKLRKGATGLDFEVKGGSEHGIPIVVSRVQEGGVADGKIDVGDEIVAVNSKNLLELKHSEAVHLLKTEGPSVTLTMRANPALRDVFAEDVKKDTPQKDGSDHMRQQPLPQGWSEKIDQQTGRPYYECHYTETTSWTDPRSLPNATPLEAYNWTALPPSWEQHRNDNGEIYYVCHDTQTTHWDSPIGGRQRQHLKDLQDCIQTVKNSIKELDNELTEKRQELIELNNKPDTSSDTDDHLDDIMILNEEVEQLDEHLASVRLQLHQLTELNKTAQLEELNAQTMAENCKKYARQLVKLYVDFKEEQSQLHKSMDKAESVNESGTGLAYLLQMPPLQSQEEINQTTRCLHLLPDQLTGKTSLELAVEAQLLSVGKKRLIELQHLFQMQTTHHMGDMVEISKIDLPNDQWINLSFKEKLLKWIECISE